MTTEELNKFCSKKAFEIAYAIFRVSKNMTHDDLSGYLESQALGLLNGAVTADFDELQGSLQAIEYFLRLGSEIGLISQGNAQIIINEGRGLNEAIIAGSDDEKEDEKEEDDDIDLESIFSGLKTVPLPNLPKTSLSQINTVSLDDDEEGGGDFVSYEEMSERENRSQEDDSEEESDDSDGDREAGGSRGEEGYDAASIAAYSAKMRQSSILDRIQEGGHFRLKDLHKLMPDLSERTLRYDLQKLVEDGHIERVGSGGPGSYYQARE